jgi:hypothetical protein
MSRARLIIKEISIRQAGEFHFFQIRLPKNVVRITGIETDVTMISELETSSDGGSHPGGSGGMMPDGTTGNAPEINRHPFLSWNSNSNPIVGKLKLQSTDRYNLFFETWVPLLLYKASLPDMSYGLFPHSPYSLIVPTKPKTIGIPCSSQVIYGMFKDDIGTRKSTQLRYRVKIFVWVQTTEPANDVQYDFENTKSIELEVKL